jgi:adenosylcobyric acid synthase
LAYEPDTDVIFSDNPADIMTADIVIVPGSKNTVKDLLLLQERGLTDTIRAAARKGTPVIGICGGYQMLGRKLHDPDGVESDCPVVDGIGLLDIETTFEPNKVTCQAEATAMENGKWKMENIIHLPSFIHHSQSSFSDIPSSIFHFPLFGYEIHMGTTTGDTGLFTMRRKPDDIETADGSANGACWGTYLHGIFDNDAFRRAVLNLARTRKGLAPLDSLISYHAIRDRAIDTLADAVREHLDILYVKRVMGV